MVREVSFFLSRRVDFADAKNRIYNRTYLLLGYVEDPSCGKNRVDPFTVTGNMDAFMLERWEKKAEIQKLGTVIQEKLRRGARTDWEEWKIKQHHFTLDFNYV